ncbi:MAG: hypothetical protein WB495_06660 [Xanthobacteraceae bacterium]
MVYLFPPLPPAGLYIALALGALAMGLPPASHFGKVRDGAPHP